MGQYPISLNEARLEAGEYPAQPKEAEHPGVLSRKTELSATTGLTVNNGHMRWGVSPHLSDYF